VKHHTIIVLSTGALALLLAVGAAQAQSQNPAPEFAVTQYLVQGNTVVSEAAAQQVLARYTGQNKTLVDVTAAANALRAAYSDAGYPIVQVFPPEQVASSGQIILRVVEGKLGKINIAGNRLYSAANITSSLPLLQPGYPVNVNDLAAAIAIANENPAKQIAVNFQTGSSPSDVDARIDVSEDSTTKYTVTADNQGSPATGRNRIGVSYMHANLFDLDHQMGVQFMTTYEHPKDVANFVGSYHIPLYGYGLSIDLVASYSDSQSTTTGPIGLMNFAGKGTYLATRLNQALPSMGELRHKVAYGIDYKDFDNNCGANGIDLPTCGTVTTQPVSLTYNFQYAQPTVQFGGNIGLLSNLAGGTHGSVSDYIAARGGASRHWSAIRASAFVGVPLPDDWQFRAQIAGQTTGDRLVPAEQFGIGGGASVRGYEERVAAGDKGYNASLELYTPDFGKFIQNDGQLKFRALAFVDGGSVRNNEPLITDKTTNLSSVGLGVRVAQGKEFSIKADIGWIRNDAGSRKAHDPSAHLALSYSF
jgi:hemolysin activation/secretion protein